MTDRGELIDGFLDSAGWGRASRVPLAGDASARRYERLTLGKRRAVLMDAAPERGESTERFARMDHWLQGHGYSAPRILASDHGVGLMLLEDFGDALFARILATDPSRETSLYGAAIDFLVDLHRQTPPDFVAPLDGPALADLTALTPEWYLRAMECPATSASDAVPGIVAALFDDLSEGTTVLSLRDFHAENLIWLPGRTGCARIGLLDFQDAVATDPAYDLVSLLQDARRDVSQDVEAAMVDRYVNARGADPVRFGAVYALLGAQRALRLVGVFARLALRDGKIRYLDYLPRVWAALERDLAHPALTGLAQAVRTCLPSPTPERIDRIKELSRCSPRP